MVVGVALVIGIGLTLAPLVSQSYLPTGWLMWLIGVTALGALPRYTGGRVLSVAVALSAYLAAASGPVTVPQMAVVMVALILLFVAQPRERRALGVAATLAAFMSLALVLWVLSRSRWEREAGELAAMLVALGFGAAAFLATSILRRMDHVAGRMRWRLSLVVCCTGMLATAAAKNHGEPAPANSLPAWRALSRRIPDPPHRDVSIPVRSAVVRQLELLRAAGFADASYAWIAMAVEENADPFTLRRYCPSHGRVGALATDWASHINLGREACNAARRWPEQGAGQLAILTDSGEQGAGRALRPSQNSLPRGGAAVLERLRGDLLMEAGRIPPALAAYRSAAAAGDRYALRDGVRALLDRNRSGDAAIFGGGEDPLTKVWLDPSADRSEHWRAWNRAMDFSTQQPVRRIGMRRFRAPGITTTMFEPRLGRRVVTTMTRYALGFAITLPQLPGGRIPEEMRVLFSSRRGFRLYLFSDNGEHLIYSCDAIPSIGSRHAIQIESPACSGGWSEVALHPAKHLAGGLLRAEIAGEFSLARIAVSPPKEAP